MSVEENTLTTQTTPVTTETETKEEPTLQSETELAQRAFALKNYEEAVDHYATALELARTQFGENTPEFADLLLVYGRALIENAIVQNSVLGGKQETEGKDDVPKDANAAGGSSDSKPNTSEGRIHFDGDPSSDDEGAGDDAVDLLGDATKEEDEEPQEQERKGEGDDDEPEDDFNAAWDVLDLARAYYDKQPGDDMKLKLAEAYMSLGDVSLETEKFEQAISDYTSGLAIKTQLLPFYSRQVCEAHYRLALVLDLTPGKLSDGVRHIEQAIASLQARATVIQERLETPSDVKGKGKGKGVATNDTIDTMDEAALKNELKDVEELLKDLSLKHEDMKAAPEAQAPAAEASEAEVTKKALDEWLKPSLPAPEVPPLMDGPVNDLSKLVKKKKKPTTDVNGAGLAPVVISEATPVENTSAAPSATSSKRKVETEEVEDESSSKEKKAKLAAE